MSSSKVKGLPDPWTWDGYVVPKRQVKNYHYVLQNSAELIRVFSGGTEEHHKPPVNSFRLIAEIWTRVFRKLNKSVTNTATLNVKNLRVIVSNFCQNTKDRRSQFAHLSSLEPEIIYQHRSAYSHFCFRCKLRRISAKDERTHWFAEHIETWDMSGRCFVAQTQLYGKTTIKLITDSQVCCLLWYADSCTQHLLQCNLTFPKVCKSITQLPYYLIC